MLPVVDFVYIRDEVTRLATALNDAFDDAAPGNELEPSVLVTALTEAIEALRARAGVAREGEPIEEDVRLAQLCDHGIDLLARLSALSGRLGRPELAVAWERLTLPYACCVARHSGEIAHLAPVANAAEGLANALHDPAEIEALHGMLDEIVPAVSPRIADADASTEVARAWRTLLINRAIVATRTHRPPLMDAAFAALVELIPAAAPSFFREGMAQMEVLDYPAAARAVMQRYHDACCGPRQLH